MSGNNFCQPNTQRTLIFDLRSQLSNLKSEFSKLITKPLEEPTKSKVEHKFLNKSKYSQEGSEKGTQFGQISPSHTQNSSKYCQSSPSLQFKRTDIINENTNPVNQKPANNYRRSGYQETMPISIHTGRYQFITTKPNQYKKPQFQTFPTVCIKKYPDISHKKANGKDETIEKTNASRVSRKNSQTSQVTNGYSTSTFEINKNNEKLKKLQQQNKALLTKVNNSEQNILELNQNLQKSNKQLQELRNTNIRKDQKIVKLEQLVKQLTQKVVRANQVTLQIGRQKSKQLEQFRQGYSAELKNQQKQFQKRLATEKHNIQVKNESAMRSTKQLYEIQISNLVQQKQKVLDNLKMSEQSVDKLKNIIQQLQKQKLSIENQMRSKIVDVRESQTIKNIRQGHVRVQNQYKEKIVQLQNQLKAKISVLKPETKQMGVNFQEKVDACVPSSLTNLPVISINTNLQPKQLQQKLTIYLNNIDKQAHKIKEQKAELQKSQRIVEQYNRIICQKQAIIRNLMRDCKILQKQSNENRRVRKQAEVLLQDANQSIIKMNLKISDQKYKEK